MPEQICPKCHYQRQTIDQSVHVDICPQCGIVYSKWLAKQSAVSNNTDENSNAIETIDEDEPLTLHQQICAAFIYAPERVTTEVFWARVITLLAFALWGGYFMTAGMDWEKIGSSFMHNINLPFHEFGHVLFMPFGNFMMILGGSLFQILLPLGLMLAFVFKQHDTFAGSIMLWWCGQSFIDLSPYIADAEYRTLPLVGGGGEESHDWGNLLTMMNLLESTQTIANGCFTLGCLIIITALIWGGFLLKKQHAHKVSMFE